MLAGAALIAGCAAVGQNFDMADVDQLQPGVTTLNQAKEKLGKPYSITNLADGRVRVIWVTARGVMTSVSSKGVAILFDKDGRMVRVVNKNEINMN
jgi:outer membrane protein assembly factor BamE (lipoprotein component of BamABCDE complex)